MSLFNIFLKLKTKVKGEGKMEANFYDVKMKQKVTAKVETAEKYAKNGTTRYAIKGKTADGRTLTCFCNQETYEKALKACK